MLDVSRSHSYSLLIVNYTFYIIHYSLIITHYPFYIINY